MSSESTAIEISYHIQLKRVKINIMEINATVLCSHIFISFLPEDELNDGVVMHGITICLQ